MVDTRTPGGAATVEAVSTEPASSARLPATVPPPVPTRRTRPRVRSALATLLLAALALAAGYYAWQQSRNGLPPGIASGNGRLEADEIDIETKFAGRIAARFVDEGDAVHAGQALARMDTRDLEASLAKAEAQVLQAAKSLDEARSNLVQQQTQVKLAQQQLERTAALLQRGYATQEFYDQRRQQMDGAVAVLGAAQARIGVAEQALAAAQHDATLYRINIADNLLIAPTEGRIQYRLANVGEVLAAGGKVFTMLDTSYVYMEIYLPTADAGRVKIGADARIVLDALSDRPILAKVSFLATQAQFTPKAVETKSERDKLMFRVKVRIDPELLRSHADSVRTGLPGIAYVRLDPSVAWPAQLEPAVAH